MKKKEHDESNLASLGKALRALVWHFGPRGANGECFDDLSIAEFIALEKASEQPNCSVQDIGVKLGFTKSGATRIVNRLVRKGYVDKNHSSRDARVCCVAVNLRGQAALNAVTNIYSSQLRNILDMLDDESREQAWSSIHALARTLKE